MKIINKSREFIEFILSSANNAADYVFGGIMAVAWFLLPKIVEIPTDLHIPIGLILLALSFIFAIYRRYSLQKKELAIFKDRLPFYEFNCLIVKIVGKYHSEYLNNAIEEYNKPQVVQTITPTKGNKENIVDLDIMMPGLANVIDFARQSVAEIVGQVSAFLPQKASKEELETFKRKADKFNEKLKGLYAIYLTFENIGTLADESIDIDVYVEEGDAIFISKPKVPDDEVIKPKSSPTNSTNLLSYNYLDRITNQDIKIRIEGELELESKTHANFWIKNTFPASKKIPLPNEEVPLFIETVEKFIKLRYVIVSKELPKKQEGVITLDFAGVHEVDFTQIDNPFKNYFNQE